MWERRRPAKEPSDDELSERGEVKQGQGLHAPAVRSQAGAFRMGQPGVLVFATASKAKVLSLEAYQLWIFQQVIRFTLRRQNPFSIRFS